MLGSNRVPPPRVCFCRVLEMIKNAAPLRRLRVKPPSFEVRTIRGVAGRKRWGGASTRSTPRLGNVAAAPNRCA